MGKRGGSKEKLSAAVASTIIRLLRAGAYKSQAAASAGVSPGTLETWLARGARGERRYEDFAREARRAIAERALFYQSIITRAALGHIECDWRTAARELERRHPKLYGRRQAAAHAEEEPVSLEVHGVGTVTFYPPRQDP